MAKQRSAEYENFDRAMTELLRVPHSEIKAQLDAEKKAKAQKKGSTTTARRKKRP